MPLPVARKSKIASHDYVEATRAFWQPHAARTLTHEDARQMAHNLVGFFNVLRDWKKAEGDVARRQAMEAEESKTHRKIRQHAATKSLR